MSGYDIKKIVDIGLSHFWNENYGQIYPKLDALVKDGLAEKFADKGSGRRKRNIYKITPDGMNVFREWLAEPCDPISVRNELQLKLFLSGKLPTEISLKIIEEYKQQQKPILDEYRESEVILRKSIETGDYVEEVLEILSGHEEPLSPEQKAKQCNIFLLTLRQGVLVLEARLKWCDEAIAHLTEEVKK